MGKPQPEPVNTERAYCRICRRWFSIDGDNTPDDHYLDEHVDLLLTGRIQLRES